MEQLTSCYFCGAALDAQIEPYQVLPPHLDPDSDQQRAVSLCPTCRQKLANVVETVVAATDTETASAVDDVTPVEPDEPLLDDAGEAPSDGTEAADAASEEVDTDGAPTAPDGETDTGHEAAPTEAADGREPQDGVETAERTHTDQSTGAERQPETATGRPGDRSTQSDPLSSDRSDGSEEQSATHTNPAGQSRDDTSQSATTESAPAETATASDESATDDGPSLTALEYNKVMRLLQNREFPVERAEIHDIATSAYQVSDREFDAIIDAAIQRGLLEEENGQLVSGGD